MAFSIDYFELLILAEECINGKTATRCMFIDSLISMHFHKMNDHQRKHMFETITSNKWFKQDNELSKHFYNRFNPDNQYKLTFTIVEGVVDVMQAYLFNNEYHLATHTRINSKYVIKAEKL